MNKTLSNFKEEIITDGNDYKRTRQYNKLSPRMKRAVDQIFRNADDDADVIADFELNVKKAAEKFKVKISDLMRYFDKETLTILKR
jgi:AraC-like DNA-binding protein